MLLILIGLSLPFTYGGCGAGGGGGSSTDENSEGDYTASPAAELQVTGTSPFNSQNNVYVGTSISVEFNTNVNMSTVNSTSFIVFGAGDQVAGSYSYNSSTYTVTFTPTSNLAYNSAYAVTLTSAIKILIINCSPRITVSGSLPRQHRI